MMDTPGNTLTTVAASIRATSQKLQNEERKIIYTAPVRCWAFDTDVLR